ncbi:MAG: MBL fold metallo-hydrolase [Bacillota bacterium]
MKACTLASGSSGNAVYIATEDTKLLVDAGLSGRAIVSRLEEIGVTGDELDAILVTHEHNDHIKGIGVLSRRYDLPVYATGATWAAMPAGIGAIREENRRYMTAGDGFDIGSQKVEVFSTSHDAADSVGFTFSDGRYKVGLATDTGCLNNYIRQRLDDSHLLIFEANHDLQMLRNGCYPWPLKQRILSDRGHLSNTAAGHCLTALVSGKTKAVMLAHLSKENNCPDLAYSTVAAILEGHGLKPGVDLTLDIAPRDNPGRLWNLEDEEG